MQDGREPHAKRARPIAKIGEETPDTLGIGREGRPAFQTLSRLSAIGAVRIGPERGFKMLALASIADLAGQRELMLGKG